MSNQHEINIPVGGIVAGDQSAKAAVLAFHSRKLNHVLFTNKFGVNVSRIFVGDEVLVNEQWLKVSGIKSSISAELTMFWTPKGNIGGGSVRQVRRVQAYAMAA
jgi:hypothetical protein